VTPSCWRVERVAVELDRASLLPSAAAVVARANNEWRTHGTTSESLEPEPKGEGTVW
jgi:hypothetical protein